MAWSRTFFREFLPLEAGRVDGARTEAEADFIARVVGGTNVLDLCCGHGRLVGALARRGYRAVGLDLDLEILREAQRRLRHDGAPALLVAADMRDLPFPCAFDGVVNFWTSFGYLETDDEDIKVIEAVARILRGGGAFVLDTVNRDWALRRHRSHEWWEAAGALYLEERRLDLARGRSEVRAVIVRDGRVSEHRLVLRLYACSELVRMVEAAGLRFESVHGGPSGEPYGLDAPRLVLVARKPT